MPRSQTASPRGHWPMASLCLLLAALILLAACGTSPTATPLLPTATTVPEPTATPAAIRAATSPAPAPATATPRPATPRPTGPTATVVFATRPATATPRSAATATSARGAGARTATARRGGQIALAGLSGQNITALAASPKDERIIYAGGKGVMKSLDGGKTWTNIRSEKDAPRVSALVLAPSNPQYVYVGVSEGCAKGGSKPGFVSADGGATWRAIGRNLLGFAVDPTNARTVYAISCEGVLRSTDAGGAWETLTTARIENYDPTLIALTPAEPATLYVAHVSEGGTIRLNHSSDRGATWQELTLPKALTGPLALVVAPDETKTVYLSTSQGLYRSLNGGRTWNLLTAGLEATAPATLPASVPEGSRSTTALAVDPDEPTAVWVGTGAGPLRGVGLFRTEDSGATWSKVGPGLEGRMVHALALGGHDTGRDSRILYIATDDGVWALTGR